MTDPYDTQQPPPQTPARAPRRAPRGLLLLLQIQAIWLIAASAGRVLIILSQHTALDPLPFVSFSLGVISIFAVTSFSHHR